MENNKHFKTVKRLKILGVVLTVVGFLGSIFMLSIFGIGSLAIAWSRLSLLRKNHQDNKEFLNKPTKEIKVLLLLSVLLFLVRVII